jgi:DNA helicase-2/ATP-dependent DNA helicase PcrA
MMNELGGYLDMPPEDVIRRVLDRSGYRQMLGTDDSQDQERLANIEELITATRQFTAEDPERTLADFLENITLASDVDGWDEEQDCVAVMTLHAAKGLEFPVVFMAAVEEGLLPHERSRDNEDELEEERRLAFVGMTRAKEELFLTHAHQRDFRGSIRFAIPSTFFNELPDEVERHDLSATSSSLHPFQQWRGGGLAAESGWVDAGVRRQPKSVMVEDRPNYVEGMWVRHDAYGQGCVMEVHGYGSAQRIRIRFSRHGEKTFIAEKAKLTVVRGA